MNRQQFDRIKAIIEQDCAINYYYELDGQTCAIGALAKEVGLLENFTEYNGQTVSSQLLLGATEALAEEYGVDAADLSEIQNINDNFRSPEERRANIIHYLEGQLNER